MSLGSRGALFAPEGHGDFWGVSNQPGTDAGEKPGTGADGVADSGKQLAKTGDDTDYAGAAALAAGGLGAATLGGAALLRRRASR